MEYSAFVQVWQEKLAKQWAECYIFVCRGGNLPPASCGYIEQAHGQQIAASTKTSV